MVRKQTEDESAITKVKSAGLFPGITNFEEGGY